MSNTIEKSNSLADLVLIIFDCENPLIIYHLPTTMEALFDFEDFNLKSYSVFNVLANAWKHFSKIATIRLFLGAPLKTMEIISDNIIVRRRDLFLRAPTNFLGNDYCG